MSRAKQGDFIIPREGKPASDPRRTGLYQVTSTDPDSWAWVEAERIFPDLEPAILFDEGEYDLLSPTRAIRWLDRFMHQRNRDIQHRRVEAARTILGTGHLVSARTVFVRMRGHRLNEAASDAVLVIEAGATADEASPVGSLHVDREQCRALRFLFEAGTSWPYHTFDFDVSGLAECGRCGGSGKLDLDEGNPDPNVAHFIDECGDCAGTGWV